MGLSFQIIFTIFTAINHYSAYNYLFTITILINYRETDRMAIVTYITTNAALQPAYWASLVTNRIIDTQVVKTN